MKNDCGSIRKSRKKFRRALKALEAKPNSGGATAWLLDNAWLVEKEALAAQDELKRDGGELGEACELARKLSCRQGEALDTDSLRAFLKDEGRERQLTEPELMLFPALLKAAFIERAARLASRLGTGEAEPGDYAKNENEAARIIASLRFLSEEELGGVTEECSAVHALFSEYDPSGYGNTDKKGRAELRYALYQAARRNRISEEAAAKSVISLSLRHGESLWYYVFDKPLGKDTEKGLELFFAFPALFAALVTITLVWIYGAALPALVSLFPALETASVVYAFALLRTKRGRYMPRLVMEGGVSDDAKTVCALVVLLRSETGARKYASELEKIMLTNRDCGKNMSYALLADLAEAQTARTESDEAIISSVKDAIDALNAKYGGAFALALRERKYCAADRVWRGEERKRGAIEALAALARGEKSPLKILSGARERLLGAEYIITLDADTRPEPGGLLRLVETISHPANRPEADSENHRMIRGCGVIQPALCCDSDSAAKSVFAAVYSGGAGFGFYGEASSELYETLFHRGSYTGKGIVSVAAMGACLSGRISPNTLLSHDLVEGEYLNSARSAETEFSESFPEGTAAYFSRLERWTRGDWQTIPWLGKTVRNAAGEECDNPIGLVGKIKILDNLRRSLTYPMIALAFALSAFFGGAWDIAATIGAAALAGELICSALCALFNPSRLVRVSYRRKRIADERAAIPRLFLRLALLPHEAATLFCAAVRGVYRLRVSRRGLLDWTTAEENAESGAEGLLSYYLRMPSCPVFGVIAMLSPSIIWKAAGVLWFTAPALSFALDRLRPRKRRLAKRSAGELVTASGEIWKYFSENLTAERNFLPPDNIRTEPKLVTAERSSPTNIGLALVSCVSAYELGLCGRSEALETIRGIISTLEKIPKWRGLLYNWYDIRTLLPLHPFYVSSVDCGNYAACLSAVKGFLERCGEAGTQSRVEALLEECRLDLLFDEKKMLFYIGINTEQGEASDSHYDLYASEALILSYYASAKGCAPAEHWRRLARTVVSARGDCGVASWSGTMFEYFMPYIFLPARRGTMYDETLLFCLEQQIKDGRLSGVWGKSESAYRSFDRAGDYRYKANGVNALALKRNSSDENVISPYSSFLALEYGGEKAMKNLRRLAKRRMKGKYGYYEALDLTRGRDETGRGKSVKCFMAHHLGMSLAAAANALCGGVIREYFLSDAELRAYLPLVKERPPVGRLAARKNETLYASVKAPEELENEELTGEAVFEGKCRVFGNGVYTVLVSSLGASRSMCMGRVLAPFSARPGGEGIGVFAYENGSVYPLQPAPEYRRGMRYRVLFASDRCLISSQAGELKFENEISVSASQGGEMRRVRVKNRSRETKTAEIALYVRPALCSEQDYEAHPAFNELCMETDYRAGALSVTRRADGFTAAFSCSEKYSFDTFEERCLGRGGLKRLAEGLEREAAYSIGAALKPCVLMRVKLTVPAGETKELRFGISMAGSRDIAERSAKELASGDCRRAAIVRLGAEKLSMSAAELDAAFGAVRSAVYSTNRADEAFVSEYGEGRRALWRFGISGDIPVFYARVSAGETKKTRSLVKLQRFLTLCGYACDLALAIDDGGDYYAPARTMICLAEIENACGDSVCAGGGVFICEGGEEDMNALRAACDAILDEGTQSSYSAQEASFFTKPASRTLEAVRGSFAEDGAYVFSIPGKLTGAVWSSILTNGRIGFIAMDCGLGEMWLVNARERRITPWTNDYLADSGGETLELEYKGEKYSLFAANDALPCCVRFGFGYADYEKQLPGGEMVRTRIFMHPELDARIMIINAPAGRLIHSFRILLGENEQDSDYVSARVSEGVFYASSSGGKMKESFCQASNVVLQRESDERGVCRLEYPSAAANVIVSGTENAGSIVALASPEAAETALAKTKELWNEVSGCVKIFTPCRELDDYINGWAVYQTLACRIMGRCSVYQSGGAFGFRDQLQDASSLCMLMPELTRSQIILAARHQYLEGDVQHWWHPGGDGPDKGVRTRCSDDLLWLPYALARYVSLTGDESILFEKAEYLKSAPLLLHEKDRYEQPERTEAEETILEHAVKAAETVLSRGKGAHGLLLFGSGDWNDGFDKLDGESVWLSWFAAMTLRELSKLCGEEKGAALLSAARDIAAAAENAWDGGWYYRGTWADGALLGSKRSRYCRIDSIAQSFSVLSGFGSPERSHEAVLAAYDMLYDEKNETVSLFTPPFSGAWRETGYIENYLPGVRENGGQYTHAAIWLAMALLRIDEADKGWNILRAVLPASHPQKRYMAEPYVLAADIYTNPQHQGRGGWSWYTGSSGWFLRAVIEELFGVRREGGVFIAEPRFPKEWKGSGVRLSILGEDVLNKYAKR